MSSTQVSVPIENVFEESNNNGENQTVVSDNNATNPNQQQTADGSTSTPSTSEQLYMNKYKSVSDMETAFKSLQSEYTKLKQSQTNNETTSQAPTDSQPNGKETPSRESEVQSQTNEQTQNQTPEERGLDMESLSQEWLENNGRLSDQTYAELAKKGITPSQVELYAEGVKAKSQAELNALASVVGGQENLQALDAWAGDALDANELAEVNSVLQTGSQYMKQMVLKNLNERFIAENGSQKNLIDASYGTTNGTPDAYLSADEIMADMAKPEYHTNEGFRMRVAKKHEQWLARVNRKNN